MIVQNKKTGKIETLTHDEWNRLKVLNLVRRFKVLDATDPIVTTNNVVIPQEVEEYQTAMREQKLDAMRQKAEEEAEDVPFDEAGDDMAVPKKRRYKPQIEEQTKD